MQHTSPLEKGRKRGDYLYRTSVYTYIALGLQSSNLSEVNKPHVIQPINRLRFLSNTTYLKAFYNLFYPYFIHLAYPSKSEKVKR